MCGACVMSTITALSVDAAGSQLAAHGVEWKNYDYDERSYIFVVRADDGHYVT